MAMTRLGYSPYRRMAAARTVPRARLDLGAFDPIRGEPRAVRVVEGRL